jgi:hypothetical protein
VSFLRRFLGRHDRDPGSNELPEIAPIYDALRGKILALDPAAVHIEQTSELPNVWGLVMDWSLESGLATIVSLADGTTSMYLSSGGGTIGAGEHAAPAAASINALHVAEIAIADFAPSPNAPFPGAGRTALTLLTFTGLRRFEENTADLQKGVTGPSQVANAMQDVIYAIRVTQGDKAT